MNKTRTWMGTRLWAAGLLLALWGTANAGASDGAGVTRATLDNGLRVIIVRAPLAPVTTTVVNYQVGSNEAPDGFPGMAHATEHIMFRGAPGLTADQLAAISAAMGGDFDADTQQEMTQYYFSTPAEDLALALRVESLRMRDVLATEDLWGRERGAIEQEVAADLSNPEYVFYTKLLEAMFHGTPYAHDALGTRPSFDLTTGAMLRQFHQTWYAPNNAILLIVGDVQPAAALREVKECFGDIPSKPLSPRPAVNPQPPKAGTLTMMSDLPYGDALVCFQFPGSDSPDFAAANVLADILASHRGRLYGLVPEGRALDADFAFDSLPKAGLGYAEAEFPKDGDSRAMVEDIKQALAAEMKHGFSADLVESSKRHEVADAEFQKNSVSGLAMAWSEAVAGEGRQSPEDDLRAIEQVTVADVTRVAKKYLDFDHAIVGILTPQDSGKPVSHVSFGGRESFGSSAARTVSLPDWAQKTLETLAVPESTVNPVVTILPNGLKLIVQPEALNGSVGVYGRVRNKPELEEPAGQEGVDKTLDQLFNFGTKSLNRVAFQKALDDIGANESVGTDFSLQVLTNYFDRGVQLLADNLLHPALPDRAFKIVQTQVAETVAGQLQSPEFLTRQALRKALFPPYDPTLRQATPATVQSLLPGDVSRYYQRVFRPDLTTIVVIGNVTADQAGQMIAKLVFRLAGHGTETGNGPPARAVQHVVGHRRAQCQPRPGQGRRGGNARLDPV
jgi:zinc protease